MSCQAEKLEEEYRIPSNMMEWHIQIIVECGPIAAGVEAGASGVGY
jgi:hypothetical protein